MASDMQHAVLHVHYTKLGLFYDIGNHQNVRKKHPRNSNAIHAFSKSFLNNFSERTKLLLVSEHLLTGLAASHAPKITVSNGYKNGV